MNALSHKIDSKVIHHFEYVLPYLKVPTNEGENQKLIEHARSLREIIAKHKNAQPAKELLNIIYSNIDAYEKRTYARKNLSSSETLAFLMEQHGLTQRDLPEIGTQPHLSKILSGERNLTREQIAVLAKRFGVSPAIFYSIN